MINSTHIFNEVKKRLEPVDSTCIFCGKGHVETPKDNVYISLYQEVKRSDVVVYKKVTYKHIKIGLPRCPHCKKMHRKIKSVAILCTLLITILVLAISLLIFMDFLSGIGIFWLVLALGFFAAVLSYSLIHHKLEKKLFETDHILSDYKEVAMQYGLVKDLLDNGWSFNQPTA